MSTRAITITAIGVAAAATAWVVVFGLRLPWRKETA